MHKGPYEIIRVCTRGDSNSRNLAIAGTRITCYTAGATGTIVVRLAQIGTSLQLWICRRGLEPRQALQALLFAICIRLLLIFVAFLSFAFPDVGVCQSDPRNSFRKKSNQTRPLSSFAPNVATYRLQPFVYGSQYYVPFAFTVFFSISPPLIHGDDQVVLFVLRFF